MLINENRWRAERYGIEESLIDYGKGELVPYADLLQEMLELVIDDATYFGCVAEVEHAREILERGTSAHRQVQVYEEAKAAGTSDEDALKAIVDMLIEQTMDGI